MSRLVAITEHIIVAIDTSSARFDGSAYPRAGGRGLADLARHLDHRAPEAGALEQALRREILFGGG
jgi:hypothetical protein